VNSMLGFVWVGGALQNTWWLGEQVHRVEETSQYTQPHRCRSIATLGAHPPRQKSDCLVGIRRDSPHLEATHRDKLPRPIVLVVFGTEEQGLVVE
jgi:hypothetical protein